MNTFQLNLNPNKSSQFHSKNFHLTQKTRPQSSLSLTQRGLNQAHRNDSTDMWKLIHGREGETQADSFSHSEVRRYDYIHEEDNDKSFKRSERQPASTARNSPKQSKQRSHSPEYDQTASKNANIAVNKPKQTKQSQNKKQSQKKVHKKSILNQETYEAETKQQKKYENLNKMNEEIKKYLQKQKFASRSLSNSAFAKMYNKPCVESYGFGNTTKDAQSSNNLLKTHNITPHTNENRPETYQSYRTALMFGKRTKIDDEERQQRLRRQFLRYFDDSVVEAAKLELKEKNKVRKSKSEQKLRKRYEQGSRRESDENEQLSREKIARRKSLKEELQSNEPVFVYRHTDKEGNVRVSTDRHGLTCYVDSGYHENQKAMVEFLKRERPILPQRVMEEDKNLDVIRRENLRKCEEEGKTGHYLVPCVQLEYQKSKYERWKKKVRE